MALYFEDFHLGMRIETPGRTVTEADLVNFSGLSGDFNIIHTDAEYASTTAFGQRLAHGLLVLSMVSGLRQRLGAFEGTLLAFMELRSWRFIKPVFIGDTIRALNEVVELRPTSKPDRGILVQKIQVVNQHGAVVQEGEAVLLMQRKQGEQGHAIFEG